MQTELSKRQKVRMLSIQFLQRAIFEASDDTLDKMISLVAREAGAGQEIGVCCGEPIPKGRQVCMGCEGGER